MVKIYVACPDRYETGGIELLHQLCRELNRHENVIAKIWYIAKSIENPQPVRYTETYHNDYVVTDTPENDIVLIFPEIWTHHVDEFKANQKIIFWESVDNYKRRADGDTLPEAFSKILHLTQSYYASNFLLKAGIDAKLIIYIGDYINQAYFANMCVTERQDIVLYNPKKGMDFTERIISFMSDVQFIPVCNMTQEQIISLMDKSKLYIDFGEHPGKDRMPREAASRGCCVITDTEGSANFYHDVPIPDKYKFNRTVSNLPEICVTIRRVLKNYEECKQDFEFYRDCIKNERQGFRDGVNALVNELYKPRFSIIIPAYNAENHIRKALDSIKQQVFKDYELIIVCDSCTDNTESIAREYTNKVFTVENHCDGPTRNKGIEEAKGDYILFMDDDDWWIHEYVLTELDRKLKEEKEPDILCFSFIFKDWLYARPKRPDNCYWVATWNKAWKRKSIGNSRFGNIHSKSDVQFHRQMFSKGLRVVEFDALMYYYNWLRKGSQTEIDRRK